MIGKERVCFVVWFAWVSYEGDVKIIWAHDSNGQFIVKSHCNEMYKGSTTLGLLHLITQPM